MHQKKKTVLDRLFLLVDPDPEIWNTFIDYVIEWAPKLRQIYADSEEDSEESEINRSD